jgi:hypothetical protein
MPAEEGVGDAIHALDSYTWSYQITKINERGLSPVWTVAYVNPSDKTWYTSQAESLLDAVTDAIGKLSDAHLRLRRR